MKKILFTAFSLSLLNHSFATETKPQPKDQCAPASHPVELTHSVQWYHTSAEQKALYHQAFNLGSDYIAQWVKANHPKKQTWGIILDIDETVLDNSWYFYQCGEGFQNPAAEFEHYVSLPKKSVALPGAAELVHQVRELGGYVSFVTNRDGTYKDSTGNSLDATVENLKQEHIEFDQVILANNKKSKNHSDKNLRFEAVINGKGYDKNEMVWTNTLPAHQVIAYFGDNIQDFPRLKQAQVNKLETHDATFDHFGHGYFIIPNPMYGSWQGN